MRRNVLSFVLLASLACAAASKPVAKRDPAYVRYSLAGEDIREGGGYKHDVKAGFYLIHTGDCDGVSRDLYLTPDKLPSGNAAEDFGSWISLDNFEGSTKAVLPRLRTGTGVNIGDSPAVVQRKLQSPPHSVNVWGSVKDWRYYAAIEIKSGKKMVPRNYSATYRFYKNKLWGINYNIAYQGGC